MNLSVRSPQADGMKVARRGVVYVGASGSNTQSTMFPSVCVLESGRWLCAFRAAPTKSSVAGQHVLVCWSEDQGHTWCDPIEPFAPVLIENKPYRVRMAALSSPGADQVIALLGVVDASDPSLPFYNDQTEGILDMRVMLAHSSDGGRTWSGPEQVDLPGYHCPTPITGPVRFLPDGRWVLSFEVNKHHGDTTPWVHESVLAVSSSAGKSWDRCHIITRDPTGRCVYWDQRLTPLPDGRLFDLFWSFDRSASAYMNIHARQSYDGGAMWSSIWDTGVPGQPAPVCALPNGALAMIYVDRTTAPVIKARLSRDFGRTWPHETESFIYAPNTVSQTIRKNTMHDAWNEMRDFSIGLPDAVPLGGGRVLVAYYAGDHADHTAIEWALLDPPVTQAQEARARGGHEAP